MATRSPTSIQLTLSAEEFELIADALQYLREQTQDTLDHPPVLTPRGYFTIKEKEDLQDTIDRCTLLLVDLED